MQGDHHFMKPRFAIRPGWSVDVSSVGMMGNVLLLARSLSATSICYLSELEEGKTSQWIFKGRKTDEARLKVNLEWVKERENLKSRLDDMGWGIDGWLVWIITKSKLCKLNIDNFFKKIKIKHWL